LTVRQRVYAPIYSSLIGGGGVARLDLAATLAIRNASDSLPLVVERIDYRDTGGQLVQAYLSAPIAIRPFGTVEILIRTNDLRGGTAASFIIDWAASGPIAEPVIEAVMAGASGTRGFMFPVPGRPVRVIAN